MAQNMTVPTVKFSTTFTHEILDIIWTEADRLLEIWRLEGEPESSKTKTEYEYIFGVLQKVEIELKSVTGGVLHF